MDYNLLTFGSLLCENYPITQGVYNSHNNQKYITFLFYFMTQYNSILKKKTKKHANYHKRKPTENKNCNRINYDLL